MSETCGNEIIKQGEICTINAAKSYGLFNEDDISSYFNSNILKSDSLKIDKHLSNTIDEKLPYSLCTLKEDIAYTNCALNNKNPWLSLNEINKCAIPANIELPNELVYNNDKTKILKPPPVYRYKSKTGYCQERWYDWFTIPDYHFGNRYTLVNEPEHPRNILQCLIPCPIGYVPRDNSNKVYAGKCISKEFYEYGLYDGTFNYLPISLILLLGSNYKSLRQYYIFLLEDVKSTILNNDLILNENVYNYIHDTNNTNGQDPIRKNIAIAKTEMNKAIINLFKIPFDYKNITVPDNNVIKISTPIITKSRILEAYNICKYFHEISNDSSKVKEYKEFKDSLLEINGFASKPYQFKKLLLILKQACNITFNGKSDYSKNYILFTLNKNKEENELGYPPIEFIISDIEKQYNNEYSTPIGNKKYANPAAAAIAGKDKATSARIMYNEALSANANPNKTIAYSKAMSAVDLITEAINASQESITDNDVSDAAGSIDEVKTNIIAANTSITTAKTHVDSTKLSIAATPPNENFITNASTAVTAAEAAADTAYKAVKAFNDTKNPDDVSGIGGTGNNKSFDDIHSSDVYRTKVPLLDEYKRSFIVADWLFIFIVIMVCIFVIYLILVLYNIFSPYLTNVVNFFVLFSQNLYYCIYDVIAQLYNKYTPSEYLKKVAERDYENAEKKVKKLSEKIAKDKNSEL